MSGALAEKAKLALANSSFLKVDGDSHLLHGDVQSGCEVVGRLASEALVVHLVMDGLSDLLGYNGALRVLVCKSCFL